MDQHNDYHRNDGYEDSHQRLERLQRELLEEMKEIKRRVTEEPIRNADELWHVANGWFQKWAEVSEELKIPIPDAIWNLRRKMVAEIMVRHEPKIGLSHDAFLQYEQCFSDEHLRAFFQALNDGFGDGLFDRGNEGYWKDTVLGFWDSIRKSHPQPDHQTLAICKRDLDDLMKLVCDPKENFRALDERIRIWIIRTSDLFPFGQGAEAPDHVALIVRLTTLLHEKLVSSRKRGGNPEPTMPPASDDVSDHTESTRFGVSQTIRCVQAPHVEFGADGHDHAQYRSPSEDDEREPFDFIIRIPALTTIQEHEREIFLKLVGEHSRRQKINPHTGKIVIDSDGAVRLEYDTEHGNIFASEEIMQALRKVVSDVYFGLLLKINPPTVKEALSGEQADMQRALRGAFSALIQAVPQIAYSPFWPGFRQKKQDAYVRDALDLLVQPRSSSDAQKTGARSAVDAAEQVRQPPSSGTGPSMDKGYVASTSDPLPEGTIPYARVGEREEDELLPDQFGVRELKIYSGDTSEYQGTTLILYASNGNTLHDIRVRVTPAHLDGGTINHIGELACDFIEAHEMLMGARAINKPVDRLGVVVSTLPKSTNAQGTVSTLMVNMQSAARKVGVLRDELVQTIPRMLERIVTILGELQLLGVMYLSHDTHHVNINERTFTHYRSQMETVEASAV